MKLENVLNVISGGTKIRIYVGCIKIFEGKMCEVKKLGGMKMSNSIMDAKSYG